MKLKDILELINNEVSIEEFAKINLLKLAFSGDGRYILNYDEKAFNTPKGWIAHYCRGLVLAGEAGNYRVIAKSFDRFYNLHENPEYLQNSRQIDYSQSFEVQFKFDGSLILQYFFDGKVRVNTRGSFAQSPISPLLNHTWEKVFNDSKKEDFKQEFPEDSDITYIYELCTPFNQVVEYYPDSFAICLGAVRKNGTEIQNVFQGQKYNCQNIDQVHALLQKLKPTQEGFIISQWDSVNEIYLRKKLKTKTWLELSHIKESSLSSNSKLWEVVMSGEKDEVASVFVHIKGRLDDLWNQYQDILAQVEEGYLKYKNIENQKEFAITIKDSKYRNCFFEIRSGKKTLIQAAQDYIRKN